jgi:YVTN family beta-propeller protein
MKSTSKMLKEFLGGGLVLLAVFALVGRAVAQVCVPPPSGLVSWWPGDGNANDIVGTNNGTLQGGVTFAPGKVAQAFTFDGVSGDAQVQSDPSLNIGTQWFVDFWINPGAYPPAGGAPLLNKWVSGLEDKAIHLNSTGNIAVLLFVGGTTYVTSPPILFSASALPLNTWSFVAVTYNGSAVKIYINGVLDASAPATGSVANSNGKLYFGHNPDRLDSPGFFKGLLDEIEWATTVPTDAQILAIFLAGSAGKCKTPPRAYVPNAGSNSVSVIDTSSNTVVATVPVGANPVNVAVTPNGGRAYVANAGSNSVSVINTGTNTMVATVLVGANPVNVAITPNGASAYVANAGASSVTVINTATNTVVATIPVGPNPAKIAITANGASAYVTDAGSNTVSVINTATNTVTATVLVGFNPVDVAIH